jgi:hypothetical protein
MLSLASDGRELDILHVCGIALPQGLEERSTHMAEPSRETRNQEPDLMMPAAPGTEGTSAAVLASAQFSLLESTPSLAPIQAGKICPNLGKIAWPSEEGMAMERGVFAIGLWPSHFSLLCFTFLLRNSAFAFKVRMELSIEGEIWSCSLTARSCPPHPLLVGDAGPARHGPSV